MLYWGYCIGEIIDHAKTRSGSKFKISLKTLITTSTSQKICTSLYDAFLLLRNQHLSFTSNDGGPLLRKCKSKSN